MRASNGMSRVKYKRRYSSRKRVRRRKWAKRFLILLSIVAFVVGGAYLLGVWFNNMTPGSSPSEPEVKETAAVEKHIKPHKRFVDHDLIGKWSGNEKVNKGKEIEFDERFGHVFIDEEAFSGDAQKHYYVSYRDGSIEFMLFYESDDPKTTIAPDGSDELYLTKGTYSIEGDILSLTIGGTTHTYEKIVESTPAPTESPVVYYDEQDTNTEEKASVEKEESSKDKKKDKVKDNKKDKEKPKKEESQPVTEEEPENTDTGDSEETKNEESENTEESEAESYDPGAEN